MHKSEPDWAYWFCNDSTWHLKPFSGCDNAEISSIFQICYLLCIPSSGEIICFDLWKLKVHSLGKRKKTENVVPVCLNQKWEQIGDFVFIFRNFINFIHWFIIKSNKNWSKIPITTTIISKFVWTKSVSCPPKKNENQNKKHVNCIMSPKNFFTQIQNKPFTKN